MLIRFVLLVIGTTAVAAIDDCILPSYPAHGTYAVAGEPNVEPGNALDYAYLNVSCSSGYHVSGSNVIFCANGNWSGDMPTCVRSCKLQSDPSVSYRCRIQYNSRAGAQNSAVMAACDTYVAPGVAVLPTCQPNYYAPAILRAMSCVDGKWDYVARCIADCGKVTSDLVETVDENKVVLEEAPWHTAIYTKTTKPYKQLCLGSLISSTVIISVAHCFWEESKAGTIDPSAFAAAVGKTKLPWDHPLDSSRAQISDVQEIKIPFRFRGSSANFQDDIAVVVVTKPYHFSPFVRPICLDFDHIFDERQLTEGNIGKVPVWNYKQVEESLRVLNLASISDEKCIQESPPHFREYITADKFCGLFDKDRVQRGNSGAGVAFPAVERASVRYYLRGVLSTSPTGEQPSPLVALTQITKHEQFIKDSVLLL